MGIRWVAVILMGSEYPDRDAAEAAARAIYGRGLMRVHSQRSLEIGEQEAQAAHRDRRIGRWDSDEDDGA